MTETDPKLKRILVNGLTAIAMICLGTLLAALTIAAVRAIL